MDTLKKIIAIPIVTLVNTCLILAFLFFAIVLTVIGIVDWSFRSLYASKKTRRY